MKKLVLITGIILISCVLISVLAAPSVTVGLSVSESKKVNEDSFIIKDNGGRIAVFRQAENEPFMVTETYTNTLPRPDREKLKNGVSAENRQELRKMLEDYCS